MTNECGGCTLCCLLFPVPELKKEANQMCKDCLEGRGCQIYKTRPKICRGFRCAYLQMEKVSLGLRPDRCKVIFEKVSDRIFFGTQDPRFEITEAAKKQIEQFNQQGFSVIINRLGKLRVYSASKHDEAEIKKEFKVYVKEKHDRTKLLD